MRPQNLALHEALNVVVKRTSRALQLRVALCVLVQSRERKRLVDVLAKPLDESALKLLNAPNNCTGDTTNQCHGAAQLPAQRSKATQKSTTNCCVANHTDPGAVSRAV